LVAVLNILMVHSRHLQSVFVGVDW
jgi:hypothetical protein